MVRLKEGLEQKPGLTAAGSTVIVTTGIVNKAVINRLPLDIWDEIADYGLHSMQDEEKVGK